MLPSHNCIIIINVQFSRYIFEFQETQWNLNSHWDFSQSLELFWILVEISGIEPLTSCLQGRRSPSWAKPPNPIDSFLEVVGQNGLAFLRKSHAGCNSPPDCCQEPAFESIFWTLCPQCPSRSSFDLFLIFWNGGPKWTRTIDLTIISRVL